MKQEVNPLIFIGVIAVAVLLAGFFIWRSLTASPSDGGNTPPAAKHG